MDDQMGPDDDGELDDGRSAFIGAVVPEYGGSTIPPDYEVRDAAEAEGQRPDDTRRGRSLGASFRISRRPDNLNEPLVDDTPSSSDRPA